MFRFHGHREFVTVITMADIDSENEKSLRAAMLSRRISLTLA